MLCFLLWRLIHQAIGHHLKILFNTVHTKKDFRLKTLRHTRTVQNQCTELQLYF